MISALLAIWMFCRHGKDAAIYFALTWGVLEAADYILARLVGLTIAEMILRMFGVEVIR